MSQLFFSTPEGNPAMYALTHPVLLSGGKPRDMVEGTLETGRDDVLLRPDNTDDGLAGRWFLEFRHGRRGVWVNGQERTFGFYLVGDEDRIRVVGGCSAVFSAEEAALSTTFPGSPTPIKCQRCLSPMEKGDPALSCRVCGAWYHFDAETQDDCCWQCEPTCRFCESSTVIGAALTRIPEV